MKKVIRVSADSLKAIQRHMKLLGLNLADSTDRLVSAGNARLNALSKYAAKSTKKKSKPKKRAAPKPKPQRKPKAAAVPKVVSDGAVTT